MWTLAANIAQKAMDEVEEQRYGPEHLIALLHDAEANKLLLSFGQKTLVWPTAACTPVASGSLTCKLLCR